MSERDIEAREQSDSVSNWLLTFSDLVALLLAFFVMMYASQKVETGNWQAMIESLSQSLRHDRIATRTPSSPRNVALRDDPRAIDLSYLRTLIEGMRENEPALADIVMRQLEDRLVIAIPGDLLFGPGRADPVARAAPRIRRLAELFRNLTNRIDVFGHTDPTPPSGRVFASNRALSLARAEAVAAMVRAAGYRRRIGAFGLGATHFADLAGIRDRAARNRLARRVDIVVRPEAEWRE